MSKQGKPLRPNPSRTVVARMIAEDALLFKCHGLHERASQRIRHKYGVRASNMLYVLPCKIVAILHWRLCDLGGAFLYAQSTGLFGV